MDKNILIKKILGEQAHLISPLLGGMMNESYIVSNNEKEYVLYVPTIQANEMVDRTLEKKCQAITYSLGITSKNIYLCPLNAEKKKKTLMVFKRSTSTLLGREK